MGADTVARSGVGASGAGMADWIPVCGQGMGAEEIAAVWLRPFEAVAQGGCEDLFAR